MSADSVNRRRVLQIMSASAVAGLAGCLGDDDDDDDGDDTAAPGDDTGDDAGPGDDTDPGEPGERVPPYVVEYWGGAAGYSGPMEAFGPSMNSSLEELGVEVEYGPSDFGTAVSNSLENARHIDCSFWSHSTSPERLDPVQYTERYGIDQTPGNNPGHYADCEYSALAARQRTAPTIEERQELVRDAHIRMSEAKAQIPLAPFTGFGAWRSDMVEANRVGVGWNQNNPIPYIYSDPTDDVLIVGTPPDMLEPQKFQDADDPAGMNTWNHLVHSTLRGYDEDMEIENVLAEDVEVNDDATEYVITLKEDAVHHNGEPVTAEDVKYTWELIWSHDTVMRQAFNPPDGWEIEVIDDRTTQFNFPESWLLFETREMLAWGIINKEIHEEHNVMEDPDGAQVDDIIGTGPYEVVDWERGQQLELAAVDDHVHHEPVAERIIFSGFRDGQAMYNALIQGEIAHINNFSAGDIDRLEEDLPDVGEWTTGIGTMPWLLYPQSTHGPSKFEEFRDAIGTALNREEFAQIALEGHGVPLTHASVLNPDEPDRDLAGHPWAPDLDEVYHFTDDYSGDTEAARQKLEEAGWDWDDDGHLLYPEDADLTPLWPEGEAPSPDDFPCLDEDGNFSLELWEDN